MHRRLKTRGLLALALVLIPSLLLSMQVHAAAGELTEEAPPVEEVMDEVMLENDNPDQDQIIADEEPQKEEFIIEDSDGDADILEESSEENNSETEVPTGVDAEEDEVSPETSESAQLETEAEVILYDDPETTMPEEEIEDYSEMDFDQAIWDLQDESPEFSTELFEEENDTEVLTEQDAEELPELLDSAEEPVWSLSLPGSQAIAYKAERTKIGTIAIKDALNFTDDQSICVTLDYSSFNSDDYSIPIEITFIQHGTEFVWDDGSSCFINPDGSDPITVYVNISAEAWDAAPHGSYAMTIQFRAELVGR